jgi:hypothetical protein
VEYGELFADSVEQVLSLLGQAPKEIIYVMLESDYGIPKTDIPYRFVEFSDILRKVLGPGAELILKSIIERFYVKLQIEVPEWTDLNEAVQTVRRILMNQLGPDHEDGLTVLH